ncbi:MAG: hypothetical protein VX265_08430 [Myxococcota bacterium]|nr:hypothetical protein [Myxococcota bacterium]
MVRQDGSPDVFCNGVPISRQGDLNTTHKKPGVPCPDHAAPITIGSKTVFVNGMGCGRVGDALTGCTAVAQGSVDTFAGG